jgi:peptidoglycan-associated lipoprotein
MELSESTKHSAALMGRIVMKRLSGFVHVMVVLVCVFALGACSKKPVPAKGDFGAGPGYGADQGAGGPGGLGLTESQWRELGLNTPAERQEFMQRAQSFENDDIYFAYNGYTLSEEARKTLQQKAEFLKKYPKAKVTVEGHCDERGTSEYNLALGERRATTAYQYLAQLGISKSNLTMISFGKERPLASGHDEASWGKNRRAHFALNLQ